MAILKTRVPYRFIDNLLKKSILIPVLHLSNTAKLKINYKYQIKFL